MKKIFLILTLLFVLLGSILIYQSIIYSDKRLHIVFCDVGQGDAIFIRTPSGSDILVDGGPDDSVLSCLAKHMPFWDRNIELMFLTHPDADHVTGLVDVIKRYRVIRFYTSKVEAKTDVYKEFLKTLKENNTKQNYLWQGDKFTFKDDLKIEALWPTHEWEGLTTNSFSVAQLLSYKSFSLLLTGDLDAQQMEEIESFAGEIDLLKVPHHGSKTGLADQFLDISDPDLAVISVGKKNRYGHPSPIILELLKEKGIKTLRTEQNGEVEIISDGKIWRVKGL